ncbi:hypothetical protein [Paenibacillus larvae]|uniref:hypothetical protein n=1 Tax=Paenibacillus larvae TaxID=1464 RepID=UPI002E15478B
MVSWRRYLHQNPELSFQEEKTAAWISARLRDWGVPFRNHVAGHGVFAEVNGFAAGPTVVLRADMDALLSRMRSSAPTLPRFQVLCMRAGMPSDRSS